MSLLSLRTLLVRVPVLVAVAAVDEAVGLEGAVDVEMVPTVISANLVGVEMARHTEVALVEALEVRLKVLMVAAAAADTEVLQLMEVLRLQLHPTEVVPQLMAEGATATHLVAVASLGGNLLLP